ncbi:MlaD family protein [Nocardia sp. NPDC050175]|uniref:MlaD family protein n=1 Tax=Nocardia sp. NPDC050175 TaxID=3364317 RepID=UPI0037BD2FDE
MRSLSAEGRQVLLGALALLTALIVAIAAVMLYVNPPQRQTVAFEITDAAAVRGGEDVRVAGVTVGTVADVRLQADHVRVEVKIRRDIYLGADTSVDIRMLTAVGGYYVALVSAGDTPLGSRTIPRMRVHPPYSLPDLVRDAPAKVAALNAPDIGASLDRVATGLEQNPGSVKSIIDSLQALSGVLQRERQQVESTLTVSREYLGTFNAHRDELFNMLRKAAIVLQVLQDTEVGFTQAYRGLAQIFGSLNSVTTFYANHREEVLAAATQLDEALRGVGTDVPTLIGDLEKFMTYLSTLLGPDGVRLVGAGQVLATDLCVPIPGRSC